MVSSQYSQYSSSQYSSSQYSSSRLNNNIRLRLMNRSNNMIRIG